MRYERDEDKKNKKRPQLKSRCQLKRVLTLSREAAERREIDEVAKFRESQGTETTERKRRK